MNTILRSNLLSAYGLIRRMGVARPLLNGLSRSRHAKKPDRRLEIGPGEVPLKGFETLNIWWTGVEDYICDAAKPLPFSDGEFDLIYASHILEHIPWYKTVEVLKEWRRLLKPGGNLELWVPNALKICQALVDFESNGINTIDLDGWYRYNDTKDPAVWASGRIFTYGDGTGEPSHPNWHRALFTPRLLQLRLKEAGFDCVDLLERSQVRGYDHGWINLGYRAKNANGSIRS